MKLKFYSFFSIFCFLIILSGEQLWGETCIENSYDFVVAKDGSGDFTTIQDLIFEIPDFRKNRTRVFIKSGVYKEKIVLPNSKTNISFIGEDKETTIFTFDDFANNNEEKFILLKLDEIEGKDIDVCKQKEYDKLSSSYTFATRLLNIASISLMFIGLIILAVFNFNLF